LVVPAFSAMILSARPRCEPQFPPKQQDVCANQSHQNGKRSIAFADFSVRGAGVVERAGTQEYRNRNPVWQIFR
jgi:hypothetical protein